MARAKGAPNVHVTPRNRGRDGWAVKTGGAEGAEGEYPTQQRAEDRAREILDGRGGGELITHDVAG
jgi:uncharacterized protein DUF2188